MTRPTSGKRVKNVAPGVDGDGVNWKMVALDLIGKIDRLLRKLAVQESARGVGRVRRKQTPS